MENALFYTFSTIAQTLAAAIALLGAFALYRFQTIGTALHDLAASAIQPYLPDDTALKLCGEEDFSALEEYLRKTPPVNPENAKAPYYLGKRNAFAHHVATLKSVQCLLKWTLGATILVIASAVTVLGLTPWLITVAAAPALTLVLGTVAFTGCLALCSVFVVRALN